MKKLEKIYKELLSTYGFQGWWPVTPVGYHKGDYSYPKNSKQRYEICVGAILTQNTNWKNVLLALSNLKDNKCLDAKSINNIPLNLLKKYIKPAGFFNLKAKKLKIFTKFYISLKGKVPNRFDLLNLWGIGKESADSMLLYAYNIPVFVIDAYTRRMFSALKIVDIDLPYEKMRQFFEENLKKDVNLYQEYHALIVKHAKKS